MSSSLVFSPHLPGSRRTVTQRSVVVGLVVALHAAVAWGVWHSAPLTLSSPPATPVMLQWVSTVAEPAQAPPETTPPPPSPPSQPAKPTVAPRAATPRVTQAPSPTPAPASPAAPEAAVEPAPVDKPSTDSAPSTNSAPEAPAAGTPGAHAAPAPAAPAPVIPAQAVQYLIAPQLRYPAISKRMGETGQVLVRVWVNEAGLPQQVQVRQSSGFIRLDEAAVAAVQGARFKPYIDNGRPTAGWAFIPLVFDLESN